MLSLVVVQRLLVASALVWAVFPWWGAGAWVVSLLLLAAGTQRRLAEARAIVNANLDALGGLDEHGRAELGRYPFAYLWPTLADAWGTTWQMSGLLSLLLGAFFVVRALLTLSPWLLVLLAPLVGGMLLGGTVGGRLKRAETMKSTPEHEHQAAHQAVLTRVSLMRAVGAWPPVPPPEKA